jgi:endonuclease/exonuclease/phosphatase family metal-dependent hydrolase
MGDMATIEQPTDRDSTSAPEEIEQDSFAPASVNGCQPERRSIIIASFNIRYAVGSFLITGSLLRRVGLGLPRRREGLVQRHLQEAASAFTDGVRLPRVDILALQEADVRTVRAGGQHVAREMARRLQMHYAHAATNLPRDEEPKSKQWYLDFEEHISRADEGDTGIALLSRLPLAEVSRVDLPWTECAWRPRLAMAATVNIGPNIGPGRIHLFNSHIDPHATTQEQLEQHAAILRRADETDKPTVLLGDFNTLTRESGLAMRRLLESRGYETPFKTGTATWRAGLIRLHTDWIFVRGLRVLRYGVARSLGVSDHWPVWVEVEAQPCGGLPT